MTDKELKDTVARLDLIVFGNGVEGMVKKVSEIHEYIIERRAIAFDKKERRRFMYKVWIGTGVIIGAIEILVAILK